MLVAMKGNDSYYRRLQANFDWYASKYDEKIEENDIENYMRETSSGILLGLFAPGNTVLEVGCGTGQETIRLLSRGIRVHAVDIVSMKNLLLPFRLIPLNLANNLLHLSVNP